MTTATADHHVAKTRLNMSSPCRYKTRPDLSSGQPGAHRIAMTSFIILQPALMDSKEPRCTVMLGVGVVVNRHTTTEGGMGGGAPDRPNLSHNHMISDGLKQGSRISCL